MAHHCYPCSSSNNNNNIHVRLSREDIDIRTRIAGKVEVKLLNAFDLAANAPAGTSLYGMFSISSEDATVRTGMATVGEVSAKYVFLCVCVCVIVVLLIYYFNVCILYSSCHSHNISSFLLIYMYFLSLLSTHAPYPSPPFSTLLYSPLRPCSSLRTSLRTRHRTASGREGLTEASTRMLLTALDTEGT